jgi:hypothetical protein
MAKRPDFYGLSLLREEVPPEVVEAAKTVFRIRQPQPGLDSQSDRGLVCSLRRGSDSSVQDGHLQLTA